MWRTQKDQQKVIKVVPELRSGTDAQAPFFHNMRLACECKTMRIVTHKTRRRLFMQQAKIPGLVQNTYKQMVVKRKCFSDEKDPKYSQTWWRFPQASCAMDFYSCVVSLVTSARQHDWAEHCYSYGTNYSEWRFLQIVFVEVVLWRQSITADIWRLNQRIKVYSEP